MPEGFHGLYFDFASNRRWAIILLTLLVTAAGIIGLFFVGFQNDLGLMIPREKTITRTLDFYRDSNISSKVVISLGLALPTGRREELINAVRYVSSSLDPGFFTDVDAGMTDEQMREEIKPLLWNIPLLLDKNDIDLLGSTLTRKGISKKIKAGYVQILKPGGIFYNSAFRSDPLGLGPMVLEKFRSLGGASGYHVMFEDGRYISPDGAHALIIAQSSVAPTDPAGSALMLGSLNKTLAGLPDNITADVISGHSHTISNERVIKSDIRLTLIIASVAFFVLFIFVIGDMSAVLIYLIPLFSVIVSVNLSYLLIGKLLYSVIGLGAVIAGISVDYAIHVYIAVRTTPPDKAGETVRQVSRPVTIGALTTVGMFLAFFFSSIEGYHQLAVFSVLSVLIALLAAIMLLPHFLSGGRGGERLGKGLFARFQGLRLSGALTTISWAALTAVLIWFALQVHFNSDITAIDGTERPILKAEERFRDVWGKTNMAIIAANAQTYEDALELNENIYKDVSGAIGPGNVSSLSSLLPSFATAMDNLERWKLFWNDERRESARRFLREEGERFDFSDNAFDPFFRRLDEQIKSGGENYPDVSGLKFAKRFIDKTESGYRILTFFPDREEYLASVSGVLEGYAGRAYIVSGRMLAHGISKVITADIKLMTGVAAGFIVLLTVFFLRSPREAIAALVPAATSVIWLLGGISALGLSLNVASLVACIVVMGLCVDYGIFMVYKSRTGARTGTTLAVMLSAVSTLIGAGVLIFADHPALFSVGIAMVIGVGSGFLSSLLVVPWLYEKMVGPGRRAEAQ